MPTRDGQLREAPEGSLRALGGTGKEWAFQRKPVQKAALRILNSTPENAARALLSGGVMDLRGYAYLTGQGILNPAQCTLIAHALQELAVSEKQAVAHALSTETGRYVLANAREGTRSKLHNLLRQDKGDIDLYV